MFRFLSDSMLRKNIFFRDVDESLVMVSAGGGGGRVIVPGNIMRDPRVFRFKLSPDQKYVMLAFRPQRLFRHSFLAQYDLYNIATGRRTKLQPDLDELIMALGGGGPGGPPPPPPGQTPPQLPLELAMWGPVGASVAYVFGANIYYRDTPESQDVMVSGVVESNFIRMKKSQNTYDILGEHLRATRSCVQRCG